jgi:hypothetical protein
VRTYTPLALEEGLVGHLEQVVVLRVLSKELGVVSK